MSFSKAYRAFQDNLNRGGNDPEKYNLYPRRMEWVKGWRSKSAQYRPPDADLLPRIVAPFSLPRLVLIPTTNPDLAIPCGLGSPRSHLFAGLPLSGFRYI